MMTSAFVVVIYGLISLAAHGSAKKCQATLMKDMTGEFSSPGYPDELYPNTQRCRYAIRAKPGHLIEITFDDFELEPRSSKKRTDFVRIIDGYSKNPSQVIYYEGTIETPFMFVSKTRRAVVVFLTNRRVRNRGFHATYRQIKGQYCDYPDLRNGWGDCQEAGNEGLYSSCDISCVSAAFQIEGSATIQCDTSGGTWKNLPRCAIRPDIAEICLANITDFDCLYDAEELADYFTTVPKNTTEEEMSLIAALGDGLEPIRSVALPSVRGEPNLVLNNETFVVESLQGRGVLKVSRSTGIQITCPVYVCARADSGDYKYTCVVIAEALQKKNKLTNEQAYNAMIQCFRCQNSGCSSVTIFD